MKLSDPQEKALEKLTNQWECAYRLRISRNTLDALVRKGFAERRGAGQPGAMFSPATTIEYRKVEG